MDKTDPAVIAGLLEESRKYHYLSYYPAVMIPTEVFDELNLMMNPFGSFDDLGPDGGRIYAVIKYRTVGMLVVDFLLDNNRRLEYKLEGYGGYRFGGFHEFVKNNLSDEVALDLACIITYG